jgi:DNA-directed RNA polymerase subunit F
MIIDMKPLSMAEAREIIENTEDEKEIVPFIKKFSKIDPKEAKKLRQELSEIGLMKLKDEYAAKIVDLLPEDAVDLNKIFVDVSLEEEEINKILEVVKKYI